MFEIQLNDELKELLNGIQPKECQVEELLQNDSIPIKLLLEYHSEYWPERPISKLLSPLKFKFKEKYERGVNYSEEFKRQLEHLKLQQEENEYQEMIKRDGLGYLKENTEELTPSQMSKQIREQITTIFNILLSVVSVVWAIWYWSSSSTRIATHNRIFLCLFFGVLVLVAEIVVYNSYLKKIEEAKITERKKREKKTVVQKLVI